MQLHNFMLTTGRFVPNGRVDGDVAFIKSCDWSDASTCEASLIIALGGRDDDVAKVETTARSAVNANRMYWIKVQKSPEMDAGLVL